MLEEEQVKARAEGMCACVYVCVFVFVCVCVRVCARASCSSFTHILMCRVSDGLPVFAGYQNNVSAHTRAHTHTHTHARTHAGQPSPALDVALPSLTPPPTAMGGSASVITVSGSGGVDAAAVEGAVLPRLSGWPTVSSVLLTADTVGLMQCVCVRVCSMLCIHAPYCLACVDGPLSAVCCSWPTQWV